MSTNGTTQHHSSPNQVGFALLVATMALILAMCAVLAVAFKLNDNGSNAIGATNATMTSGGSQHHSMMTAGDSPPERP